jgi:hypothetical protein
VPAAGLYSDHATAATIRGRFLLRSDSTPLFVLIPVPLRRWSVDVTEAMRRYWNDPEETAEQGAYALAFLMLRSLVGLTVLERSRKGTGFDWWLAPEDNLFQATARLEVSGLMSGSVKRVNGRLKAKLTQTERSDPSGLTAYVAVVEFGTPRAKVVQR